MVSLTHDDATVKTKKEGKKKQQTTTKTYHLGVQMLDGSQYCWPVVAAGKPACPAQSQLLV